jgi:hypothetical protein
LLYTSWCNFIYQIIYYNILLFDVYHRNQNNFKLHQVYVQQIFKGFQISLRNLSKLNLILNICLNHKIVQPSFFKCTGFIISGGNKLTIFYWMKFYEWSKSLFFFMLNIFYRFRDCWDKLFSSIRSFTYNIWGTFHSILHNSFRKSAQNFEWMFLIVWIEWQTYTLFVVQNTSHYIDVDTNKHIHSILYS